MAQIVTFADVDDNLITSTRVCPEPGAQPIATDNKGAICAYLTPKQRLLVDWLLRTTRLIPTTARSSDGFNRVQLPFNDFAIVSFGGIILTPERLPQRDWYRLMQQHAHVCHDELLEHLAAVNRFAARKSIDVRTRIVTDFGLPLFLSVKHNQKKQSELEAIKNLLAGSVSESWKVHLNANNLAVMPPYLRKEKAVQFARENLIADPDALVLGAGDSLSDVPFLGMADFAFIPANSQAFSALSKEAGL